MTAGGAFAFMGDVGIRFREEDVSYDTHFRYDHQPEIVRICDPEQYIVVRHGSNNWNSVKNKDTNRTMSTNDYLRGLAPYKKTARELLDSDSREFYGRVLRWRRRG
jgi:hypothetical protein